MSISTSYLIRHNTWLALCLITSFLTLAGCSHEQAYEAIQQNRQFECRKLVPQSQYEECMKSLNVPYETYKRSTDEAVRQ